MGRLQHIEDERLFDCYLTQRTGESVDPPLAEHLADCPSCADRLEELSGFMNAVRTDGIDECDALFTAEHLRAQRERIAVRLEQTGRVARIISFPGRFVARHVGNPAARMTSRWTAAAAAAGLIVGVGLGIVVDQQRHWQYEASLVRPAPVPAPIVPTNAAPLADTANPVVADFETFVFELDQLRGGPRSPELRLLDAMTPHVHPTALQVH
jgi:hypothetical protein